MNYSLVLARKNSKRIKNKNIKRFCGKPLIYWPINTLKKSKFFDQIYISTDSVKIEEIAKKYGASSLGLRDKKLANNFTDTITVVKNFIKKNKFKTSDLLCCTYGSSPFFSIKNLKKAFFLLDKKTDFVFMAKQINNECLRSFYIKKNKSKKIYLTSREFIKFRSQDLPKIFLDTGQFYLATIKTWRKSSNIFTVNSKIIINNSYVDINTTKDFKKAQIIFKKKISKVKNV
jgi:pseudaminic acid cytidylyltransferase